MAFAGVRLISKDKVGGKAHLAIDINGQGSKAGSLLALRSNGIFEGARPDPRAQAPDHSAGQKAGAWRDLLLTRLQQVRHLSPAQLSKCGNLRQLLYAWPHTALPFVNRLIRRPQQQTHFSGGEVKPAPQGGKALGTEANAWRGLLSRFNFLCHTHFAQTRYLLFESGNASFQRCDIGAGLCAGLAQELDFRTHFLARQAHDFLLQNGC